MTGRVGHDMVFWVPLAKKQTFIASALGCGNEALMYKFTIAWLWLSALGGCIATRTANNPLLASESQAPAASKQALLQASKALMSADAASTAAALQALSRQRGSATAAEQDLIDAYLALLQRPDKSNTALDQSERDKIKQLSQRIASLYPTDFAIQLATTTALVQLAQADASVLPATPADTESIQRVRNLAADFPQEAEAYALLAKVLASDQSQQLAAMRAYKKCATLANAPKNCSDQLRALAKAWLKPHCIAYKQDGIALHAAFEQPAKRRKAHKIIGSTLYVETPGDFHGLHIEDIATVKHTATEATPAHSSVQTKLESIQIALTPSAAGRFSEWTRRLAEQNAYIAVRVGKRFVATPRVLSAIDTGQFTVSTTAKITWPSICQKFETRQLPADLAAN